MTAQPRVSAVIVHYQSPFSLARCLKSLQAPLHPGLERIVVDNHSPDWDPAPWRRDFPGVAFLSRSANGGYGVAANEGMRSARGEFLWLLNADTAVWPETLPALLRFAAAHPEAGILGPKILNAAGAVERSCRTFPRWWTPLVSRCSPLTLLWPDNRFSRRYLASPEDLRAEREAEWVSGACLFIRRRTFEQTGGFDERFFLYMEDVDLCLRTRRAGWKIFFVPQAVILHRLGSASAQRKTRCIVEHHRSIWRYYAKHFRRGALKDIAIAGGILLRGALEAGVAWLMPLVRGCGGETYREARLKRPMDIALSLLGLALTWPLWSVVPWLIWLEDRGPIFYRQSRVGRGGRLFNALKFRTMRAGGPAQEEVFQARPDDPRVTRLGRWLRRAAIDEIPQLVNILRGDMSLVGPRALMPEEIERDGRGRAPALNQIPGWERRAFMRPGLTGIAQVFARRDLARRQKFRYDLLYLRGLSVWFDLKIIVYSAWISLAGAWEKVGRKTTAPAP